MPPKKRGRAKAPAKAKQQAKKQPGKQAAKKPAKKPAKKAPKEDDVRSGVCYIVTAKDSVKVKLNDSGNDGTYDTLGPIPTLEYGCRDDEWYKDIGEGDGEFTVRHQSHCGMAMMSRQDAVLQAGEVLMRRIKTYGPLVLQLTDDYINNYGDREHPVYRDMVTTEPGYPVETRYEWTRNYTYTDDDGSCQCEAKFTTEVKHMILMQPGFGEETPCSSVCSSDVESL